ncbi:11354_t:CDS:2, partial [Racocetra persica]
MTQLQDQQRSPSRSRSGNFTPSTVTCFTCGHTGHYRISEDESLFLLAERPIHPKPIVNMPIIRKKSTGTKTTDLIDLEEGENTKDLDVEMEEVYKDHKGQGLQNLVTQNQNQDQDESAKLLEVKKVELPKVNKKKEDVK